MLTGVAVNPVSLTLGGLFVALGAATGAGAVVARRSPGPTADELMARLRSWWIIIVLFAGAIMLGQAATVVLLAVVSFLALKEYLSLVPVRQADRRLILLAYLAIPVQFLWVGIAWYGMFIIFVPVYVFLLLAAAGALAGVTDGYLRAVGVLHLGLMLTVFSLAHAAYLLVLPPNGAAATSGPGGPGLLLFLVLLTQFNDVAQYVFGRLFGRHKVVPKVSPNKTWQGLIGGVCSTTLLAVVTAPYLTPLQGWQIPVAGLLIGGCGFVGDVTLSAIKRDLGVKDWSRTIPGHGGMLDRLDSLTYAAPLFFHFIRYLHY